MASRDLKELHPLALAKFQEFLDLAKHQGLDVLVTSTYRSIDEQNLLYEQGRSSPGKIVTNARGGESFHNFRVAIDIVPLRSGKPLWDVYDSNAKLLPEWKLLGDIAESLEIEWAGNWRRFREYAHFQYTQGLTLKDFQKGRELS